MRKVAFRLGLAVAALALTLPMMAKADNKAASSEAKPKNTTLTIDSPVKFGDTTVKPGTYKLVIESDKATIENGKTVVASAPGHWEDRKQKVESTGFETTNGAVDSIFVHGESSAFVLGDGSQVSKK
jgi:hypothetical protein